MSDCTHDLTDREVACADGMCPMCLAADNDALRVLLLDVAKGVDEHWQTTDEGIAVMARIDAALINSARKGDAGTGGGHDY